MNIWFSNQKHSQRLRTMDGRFIYYIGILYTVHVNNPHPYAHVHTCILVQFILNIMKKAYVPPILHLINNLSKSQWKIVVFYIIFLIAIVSLMRKNTNNVYI